MQLSLGKLPWYAQVGAFVVVSAAAVFGFWNFYVQEMQADIATRAMRLTSLRADVAKGMATARRLPEFQTQVTELQHRLDSLRAVLPEQKDVAEILRRVQGLATLSNLQLQSFQPQPAKQLAMYAELPHKLQVEGSYHSLGAFLDKVSKFHRIITVGEIHIKAATKPQANSTITAECVATTFVLQEGKTPPKPGAPAAAPVKK